MPIKLGDPLQQGGKRQVSAVVHQGQKRSLPFVRFQTAPHFAKAPRGFDEFQGVSGIFSAIGSRRFAHQHPQGFHCPFTEVLQHPVWGQAHVHVDGRWACSGSSCGHSSGDLYHFRPCQARSFCYTIHAELVHYKPHWHHFENLTSARQSKGMAHMSTKRIIPLHTDRRQGCRGGEVVGNLRKRRIACP
jgi:hypothetical protein